MKEESDKDMAVNLPSSGVALKDIEKQLVLQALQTVSGNQTRAARLLGISRDSLRYKMQKMGLL